MSKVFDLPVVLGVPDLRKYLRRVEARMDAALGAEQSKLTDAVRRLTKARGKRLRPALCIASALLCDDEIDDSVIKASAAVELIHIGSLVHDDIIDESSTRWNIPTISAQEGLDYAIVGGDFLFARACVLAGAVSQRAGVLAAETIAELCKGESAELSAQYKVDRTEAHVERAVHGKTAALMAAACTLGGISTNLPDNKLAALSSFGSDLGMGFQLIDDVLDFISTDVLMGKPVGNDIKEGVYTLPIILSLNGPKRTYLEKELAKKSGPPEGITELLLANGSIDESLARAKDYNRSAEQALTKAFGKSARKLAQLPSAYLDWALSSLVAPQYKDKIIQSA